MRDASCFRPLHDRSCSQLHDDGGSDTATEAEEEAVASVVNGDAAAAAAAAAAAVGFDLLCFEQVRAHYNSTACWGNTHRTEI